MIPETDPDKIPVSINEPPGSEVAPPAEVLPVEPPPVEPPPVDQDELEDELDDAIDDGDIKPLHRRKPHRKR